MIWTCLLTTFLVRNSEMAIINDYRGSATTPDRECNVQFYEVSTDGWPHVFVQTTTSVPPGAELLLNYLVDRSRDKYADRSRSQALKVLRSMPPLTDLFTSGTLGINTFRVPNLITTRNGSLVAIAQGKLFGRGDSGATNIMLRRSDNNGASWSAPSVVLSDPLKKSAFDAVLAYEPQDDTLMVLFHDTCANMSKVCGPCVSSLKRSSDLGVTWSATTNLPNVSFTGGSGVSSGISLTSGLHKGRLLIPQRHDCNGWGSMNSFYALISDDKGQTFTAGGLLPHGWSECQLAELKNGSVVITSRNDAAKMKGKRLFARSDDGAQTWVAMWEAPANLPDPKCQAALIADPAAGLLYFGNPASNTSRTNYSVHVSRDGGLSWDSHAEVYAGGAAYSDMTLTATGQIACLFEKDGYKEIALGAVPPVPV
jgi:sialidase-1